MRTYFRAQFELHHSAVGNTALIDSAKYFKEKYHLTEGGSVTSGSLDIDRFFAPPIHLSAIYAYSEGATVHEFFSGLAIGKATQVDTSFCANRFIIDGNLYGKIPAYSVSAEDFSKDIEPFMRHKDTIAKVMTTYFELHKLINAVEQECLERARNKTAVENRRRVDALESFLNHRK